jgi:hypothetical protein
LQFEVFWDATLCSFVDDTIDISILSVFFRLTIHDGIYYAPVKSSIFMLTVGYFPGLKETTRDVSASVNSSFSTYTFIHLL